jgi:hypothetical protein
MCWLHMHLVLLSGAWMQSNCHPQHMQYNGHSQLAIPAAALAAAAALMGGWVICSRIQAGRLLCEQTQQHLLQSCRAGWLWLGVQRRCC